MNISDKILNDERYKSRIESLGQQTLEIMAKDRIKALEYAQKGIEQEEPEKINDVEYLELVADNIQKLANSILEKKS